MNNNKGYVLVIVLLILAITTAVVIDFAGTVYGYVNTANNFTEAERLSLLLRSAYIFTAEKVRDLSLQGSFNNQREFTLEEKLERTTVGLLLEDNNSKFNLNSLVYKNGFVNETGYNIFKRLLRELKADEEYADRLVDFIDPDKIPGAPGSEDKAKNKVLSSLSELGYIFPDETVKTLLPYLTVFGDGKININTAEPLLLRTLHPGMTRELAERIAEVRKGNPFERMGDIVKFPGMSRIGIDISDFTTVKSSSFSVRIRAESDDLTETAEAGFDLSEGRVVTKFWRER